MIKKGAGGRRPGLMCGVARAGLAGPLGPQRAIVTYPTLRAPARVDGGSIQLFMLLTGDPTLASPVMMVSLDGANPIPRDRPDTDDRPLPITPATHIPPGTHPVNAWRTTENHPPRLLPLTK